MDDIVAVEVRLESGENCCFLTWGRIQDRVDPEPLAALVLRHAGRFSLDGIPVSARVLWSLHPATAASYSYEYFFEICQERIPYGRRYEKWRQGKSRGDGARTRDLVPRQPWAKTYFDALQQMAPRYAFGFRRRVASDRSAVLAGRTSGRPLIEPLRGGSRAQGTDH